MFAALSGQLNSDASARGEKKKYSRETNERERLEGIAEKEKKKQREGEGEAEEERYRCRDICR